MKEATGPVRNFPLADEAVRAAADHHAANAVDFANSEKTCAHLSDGDLRRTALLFRLMGQPWLTNLLSTLGAAAVKYRLPGAAWAVKNTIFRQFVGGTSLVAAQASIRKLGRLGVDSILDYGAEAKQTVEGRNESMRQILAAIDFSAETEAAIGTVVKVSSIVAFDLLAKFNEVAATEPADYDGALAAGLKRLDAICGRAHQKGVELYIDAEESWIQHTIDRLAERMMERYNRERVVVITTCQLYRHDRLAYLKDLHERGRTGSYLIGVKLVRGAYLVKENDRAGERGYPTPIQPTLAATHADYNAALRYCFEHRDTILLCLATHNEESTRLLTQLIDTNNLRRDHPHLRFSQLLGMSGNLTFNLADAGFNVSKYMVYGPVTDVLPYLVRRAQENTSVTGEAGRELRLVLTEISRRAARS